MYGGKLINKICKDCTNTVIKILKARKLRPNQKNTIENIKIRILENLVTIFSILSELDGKLYEIYLKLKRQNVMVPRELINYTPILSIYFSLILIFIIHKTKFSKSLSVDRKIIQKILLSCVKGNISLIKENIKRKEK